MRKSPLKIALGKYQTALAAWKQCVSERNRLRAEATELYELYYGEPHIHNATDLETCFPGFIAAARVKKDIQDEAQELWNALRKCPAKISESETALVSTKATLSELVDRGRSQQADLLTARWTAMSREVVGLLTPYCSSPQKAKELSRECDKLSAIEFEIDQWRRPIDPEIAAERLVLLETSNKERN
jgi:hypothetical protein